MKNASQKYGEGVKREKRKEERGKKEEEISWATMSIFMLITKWAENAYHINKNL